MDPRILSSAEVADIERGTMSDRMMLLASSHELLRSENEALRKDFDLWHRIGQEAGIRMFDASKALDSIALNHAEAARSGVVAAKLALESSTVSLVRSELELLRSEVERLRGLIKDMPHDIGCPANRPGWEPARRKKCNCIKSKVGQ